MLTLTENASTIVTSLISSRSDAPEAGLRIHTREPIENDGTSKLAVDVTPAPEPHDQVVESSGARVFLEENAALILNDKVLDADVDAKGAVSFALLPQRI